MNCLFWIKDLIKNLDYIKNPELYKIISCIRMRMFLLFPDYSNNPDFARNTLCKTNHFSRFIYMLTQITPNTHRREPPKAPTAIDPNQRQTTSFTNTVDIMPPKKKTTPAKNKINSDPKKVAKRRKKQKSNDEDDKVQNPHTDILNDEASQKTVKTKNSKKKATNDSIPVTTDSDRTESRKLFDSLFFEEFATTNRTTIKYPKKEIFPMYIDILKGNKGDTKEMKEKYNVLRPRIRKKYCLHFDTETNESILYSSNETVSGRASRRIAAYEELFDILYANCVESNHNIKVAQVRIFPNYGNISNILIIWFQENCCVGCMNKRKHGNCKQKLKTIPIKANSDKDKYMSLMASLTAMGNLPKPTVIESIPDDNVGTESLKDKELKKSDKGLSTSPSKINVKNGGRDAIKALEYMECENLFAKAIQRKMAKDEKKKNNSEKLQISKSVLQITDQKSSGAFQIELDNSRTGDYPGCYLNCIVQALWHVFDAKHWTLYLQMCLKIADKKSSLNKELNELAIAVVDDNADEDMQQEIMKTNQLNILKRKNLIVKYEVLVNFMDVLFRGLQCENLDRKNSVLITRPCTLKLAKLIMENDPGPLGTDPSVQHDCMEIFNAFLAILREVHQPLTEFIRPNIQKVLKCSKCKKVVRTPFTEDHGTILFFGSHKLSKQWKDKVVPEEAGRSNAYYFEMTKKHQGTFVDITIQDILDNIHVRSLDDDTMIRSLPKLDEEENEPAETDDDKLKRWNDISGLNCSKLNCTSGKFTHYHQLVGINEMIVVSSHAMGESVNLVDGELTEEGKVIDIKTTGSGYRQLVPKFWPSDVDKVGELKFGRKKVKLRLDVIIFRTSNLNSNSGHFIMSVRNEGRACKESADKWTTFDDEEITPGLPDKNEYFPTLYIFVKRS